MGKIKKIFIHKEFQWAQKKWEYLASKLKLQISSQTIFKHPIFICYYYILNKPGVFDKNFI